MAFNYKPVFTKHVFNYGRTLPTSLASAADGATYRGAILGIAPSEGWRLTEISLINSGTVGLVSIYVGTAWNACTLKGVISVPEDSGTDGAIPAVDALNTTLFPSLMVDNAGNKYIDIEAGNTVFLISDVGTIVASLVIYDYKA